MFHSDFSHVHLRTLAAEGANVSAEKLLCCALKEMIMSSFRRAEAFTHNGDAQLEDLITLSGVCGSADTRPDPPSAGPG